MATYEEVHQELLELFQIKNRAYSGEYKDQFANFRKCEAFGIQARDGILTRMSDKWERLQNVYADPSIAGTEALEDTVADLANYAIILLAMLRESR